MTGESLILADLLTEGLASDTVVAREGLETLSSSLPALENSGGGAMVETVPAENVSPSVVHEAADEITSAARTVVSNFHSDPEEDFS